MRDIFSNYLRTLAFTFWWSAPIFFHLFLWRHLEDYNILFKYQFLLNFTFLNLLHFKYLIIYIIDSFFTKTKISNFIKYNPSLKIIIINRLTCPHSFHLKYFILTIMRISSFWLFTIKQYLWASICFLCSVYQL